MARKHALEDSEGSDLKKKKTKIHKGIRIEEECQKVKAEAAAIAHKSNASASNQTTTAKLGLKPGIDTDTKTKFKAQSKLLLPTQALGQSVSPSALESDSVTENKQQNASPREDNAVGILPADLEHLLPKYSFATISIKSHSKINKKVTTMIQHMSRFDFMDPSVKPGIVVLDAKSSDANKMISVVEIAKKHIFENNRSGKWYQYNRVGSETVRIPRKASKEDSRKADVHHKSKDVEMEESNHVTEDQTNEQSSASKDLKLRAIPTLTIYMSRVSIPELKAEFGEQSNTEDIVKWWEPLSKTRKETV